MLASRFGGALSESALDVNALNIDNALNIEVFLPKDFPPEQECMQQIWQSINLPFQLLQRSIFTLHSAAVQTRFEQYFLRAFRNRKIHAGESLEGV